MRAIDLVKYSKYLEDTKNQDNNSLISDELYLALRDIFMNDLLKEMSSDNPEIKALAVNLSKKFLDSSLEHKRRFLMKLSSYK